VTTHKHLSSTFKQLERVEKNLETLTNLALELGAEPNGLHADHAVKTVVSACKELLALKQKAEQHGTTLGRVVEGYCRQKTKPDLNSLYSSAPPHWVTAGSYRKEQVVTNGLTTTRHRWIAGTTPAQAQGKLRALRPLLEELHEKFSSAPDYLDGVLEEYQRLDYSDFYSAALDALYEEKGGSFAAPQTVEQVSEPQEENLTQTLELLKPNYRVLAKTE
jgi:hypothetical protein